MSYDYTANNTKLDAFRAAFSVDSPEIYMFLSWSLFCQIFLLSAVDFFSEHSVNEGNEKSTQNS